MKIKKFIRLSFVIGLISLISLVILIHIPIVQKVALSIVLDRINVKLPIKIEVKSAYVSPFTGFVQVKNARILSKTEKPEVIASINTAIIYYRLIPLLKGQVRISKVQLDNPFFRLDIFEGNKTYFNMEKEKPANQVKNGLKPEKSIEENLKIFFERIIFEKVWLKSGEFNLSIAEVDFSLNMSSFDLEMAFIKERGDYNLSLNFPSVKLDIKDKLSIDAEMKSNSLCWKTNGAEIKELELRLKDSSTAIKINHTSMLHYDPPLLTGNLIAELDLQDLNKIMDFNFPIYGEPVLTAYFEGPADNLLIDTNITSEMASIFKLNVQNINIKAIYQDLTLKVPQIKFNIADGQIGGEATVGLKKSEMGVRGKLSINKVDYNEIAQSIVLPYRYNFSISSLITFDMPDFKLENMSSTGYLSACGILPQKRDFSFKTNFQMKNAKLEIEDLHFNTQETSLKLNGGLDLKGEGDLKGEFSSDNLQQFSQFINQFMENLVVQKVIDMDIKTARALLPAEEIKGRLWLDFRLKGNLAKPELSADIKISEGNFFSVPAQSVNASVSWSKNGISLKNFKYSDQMTEISCKANVLFKPSPKKNINQTSLGYFGSIKSLISQLPPSEIDLSLVNVDVNRLAGDRLPLLKEIGKIDGSIWLRNSFPEFIGSIKMSGEKGALFHQSYDHFDLNLSIQPDTFLLKEFTAGLQGKIIRINGSFGKGDIYSINLNTPLLNTSLFQVFNQLNLPLNAEIKFALKGEGTITQPSLDGHLEAKNLEISSLNLGDAKLDVKIQNQILKAELYGLKDAVKADFSLDISPEYPFQLATEIKHLRFEPIISSISNSQSPISGYLSGNLTYQGNLADFMTGVGNTEISDLNIAIQGIRLKNKNPIKASMEGKKIMIKSFEVAGKGIDLDIKGEIEAGEAVEMKVIGYLNPAILPVFVPSILYAEGNVNINAQISGKFPLPSLMGNIDINCPNIRIIDFPDPLRNLEGKISLSPTQITVKDFKGRLGKGNFQFEGSLFLTEFKPSNLDLEFNATDLELKIPKGVYSIFDAKLRLTGDFRDPLIDGSVEIERVRVTRKYDIDILLGENVANLVLKKKVRQYQPTTYEAPSFDPRLNIHIFAPQTIFIDNNLANLTMEADLDIKGRLTKPLIFGRVSAEKGTVYFQDRKFELTSAIIDFLDPVKIDPFVDINAQADIQEYHITLNINGTAGTNFSVKVTSDPPLDELSIYSLIGFGKTKEQLMETGEGTAANQAAILLSNMLSAQLERRAQMIGLDRFQIEPNISSEERKSSTKVTVGKKISDDLYVIYTGEISGAGSQLILVEYKLSDNVVLVGERNQDNIYAGNLKFRFEFKY